MDNKEQGFFGGQSQDSGMDQVIIPNANYSRWMSDIFNDIGGLKVNQLALPSAHNSGVDATGTWGPNESWGACQTDTFAAQLAWGARVLDLRLVDASYRKFTGNNSGSSVFKEVFIFKHGIADAGRRLEHCIQAVKDFTTSNPGEIVILSFDKYDLGNHSGTSVKRCLPYFNPIKDRLIPRAAQDLTVAQIRQQYPGKSVIIAWDHWRESGDYWGKLDGKWTGQDFTSPDEITVFCEKLMAEPPSVKIWSLSATAYNNRGPVLMSSNHKLWAAIFKPGFKNCNIVNVDFIERTGVVDHCIALNKARGQDKQPPTTPSQFTAVQVKKDGIPTDLVELKWNPSTDAHGVRMYEIYQNGQKISSISGSSLIIGPVRPLPYVYKVRALDASGNISAFSTEVALHLEDINPSSKPGNFRLSNVKMKSVTLEWDVSYDFAGVVGYRLIMNHQPLDFVQGLKYEVANLDVSTEYEFIVQAVDANNLYSQPAGVVLAPRPGKPENMRSSDTVLNGEYIRLFAWTPNIYTDIPYAFQFKIDSIPYFEEFVHYRPHEDGTQAVWVKENVNYNVEVCSKLISSGELSEPLLYSFIIDNTPPVSGPSYFRVSDVTHASAKLNWEPGYNRVASHALSRNEEHPILLPKDVGFYMADGLKEDTEYLFEIWFIDANEKPSMLSSVTFRTKKENPEPEPEPEPGSPPTGFRFIKAERTAFTIGWTAPSDSSKLIGYTVVLTSTAPRYFQLGKDITTQRFGFLNQATRYQVQVIAKYENGTVSSPLLGEGTTL
ncbi:fibronectin type III domain-containing protein [Pseudomonas vancouverensis]|uniref:Fibronectin type-III domain-containing protein n=1 Tax=Pseudomonas vancouverensis TaxID=95300 RepID=A0A1H2MPA7_PSEVA|nr:fibronectin type III domain-containing protein [Pseudomonas vancouverensis]KAB0494597.1 hypothetical protein F7R09_18255 [Pseudomonas vancouverensis]TDB59263.1 hypothetical protein EIY72_19660 [Pseudomonas vancouverensis]SDU95049.1 hypothetical protein SAMN05216558_1068 [Pseudomonas vancouverensis]